MQVTFGDDGQIPSNDHGRIKSLLQGLAVGQGAGHWSESPDTIDIVRRLAGGRSGAMVLEAVVTRRNQKRRAVIKLGTQYDLQNEFAAWQKYFNPPPTALFVPIQAVSKRLAGRPSAQLPQEVVVYIHAADYHAGASLRSLEEVTQEALATDDGTWNAEQVIGALFDGIRSGLYDRSQVTEQPTSHRDAWNERLGFAATVTVNMVDGDNHSLSGPPGFGLELYPHDVAAHALGEPPAASAGSACLAPTDVRLERWGDQLVASIASERLLLRVEGSSNGVPLKDAPELRNLDKEQMWTLSGTLTNWRNETGRRRLQHWLGPRFSLANGTLDGPDGGRVPDPFPGLSRVMDSPRDGRVTSVVHGDLNPRNVLVVDRHPCVIDYAQTKDGQPVLSDFVRLEAILMAEVFAGTFTWAQLLRLQRWLALTCRLAGSGAVNTDMQRTIDRFANVLGEEQPKLGRAFRILWALRAAARKVAPPALQAWWSEDYLEQLFLFGHQMLKWLPDESETDGQKHATARQAAIAAASILGAATESLEPARVYELWPDDELKRHAETLLSAMRPSAVERAADLASLGRRLRSWQLKANDPRWLAFREVRQQLVRQRFEEDAVRIEDRLKREHDVYISLKAYIDLKGQLREVPQSGRRKAAARYFAETLQDDEAVAESERLRPDERKAGDDALQLVAGHAAVVLLGDAGAGKSTLAREWEYRLAKSIRGTGESPEPRLPIVVRASAIASSMDSIFTAKIVAKPTPSPSSSEWNRATVVSVLEAALGGSGSKAFDRGAINVTRRTNNGGDRLLADLCEAGAVALIVDALNELADADKQRVAGWIVALHDCCPLSPLLVCHRQYNYSPGFLPFPVITLQKVEQRQAERYIRDYLRAQCSETSDPNESPEALAERLIALLLKSPDHQQVRDLAQTPLFLWMIVQRFSQTRLLPPNRARLFDDFSRWYLNERHHEEHQETVVAQFDFEKKATLLGRLGYELVRRRETELPESEFPRQDGEAAVLEEIVTAELLHREGEGETRKLRFLHQSFQEYFAARHILPKLAADKNEIKQRVSEFGWHDTFLLLLGFGGEHPDVVRQVVDAALKVNPRLTARCLRMAEAVEPALLEQFVAAQVVTLADPRAGTWDYQAAAEALAEYGRGTARRALWDVITDPKAPEAARCQSLEAIVELPGQIRFESLADKLRGEFVERLQQVFDEPAPLAVQRAAMDSVVKVKLTELSSYLTDLISANDTTWPLRRAAWDACQQLNLPLKPKWRDAYRNACQHRLAELESELYEESIFVRMRELNDERLAILEQLASRDSLPLLLSRRFAFIPKSWSTDWNDRVAKLLNELTTESPSGEAHADAWAILTEPATDSAEEVARWFNMFLGDAELLAQAAAHRLIAIGKKLPIDRVREALLQGERGSGFAWWKFSALARMAAVTQDKSLVDPLDQLIRRLIDQVAGREQVEAFTNLAIGLSRLDQSIGNRTVAVAGMVFHTARSDNTAPGQFPFRLASVAVKLDDDDCSTLFTSDRVLRSDLAVTSADSGREPDQALVTQEGKYERDTTRSEKTADTRDALAAIFFLSAWGGGVTFTAQTNGSPTKLSPEAVAAFCDLAERESEVNWQHQFARAAVKGNVDELLSWLVRTADSPTIAQSEEAIWDDVHGLVVERNLAGFLRTIGYLTRRLLDEKQFEAAKLGIDALEKRRPLLHRASAGPNERETAASGSDVHSADEIPHRSIIVGLVTGLGYLGDWQPILEQLGPGEPWLHKAAKNVCGIWVPGPLAKSPDQERERAALWIANRLRTGGQPPEVRSTLQEILASLEEKLGRHIRTTDGPP